MRRMCVWSMGLLALGLLYTLPLGAQVIAIEDDFEDDDPCAGGSGWICQGASVWVAPNDPENLFVPAEGYVLATPATVNLGGNMFRTERIEYNDFRLIAEVELQGSCDANPPADGMAIVIVGSDAVPGLGWGGGGMGATEHGPYPHMIFEFDNWNNGATDRNDNNHVGFSYRSDGFVGYTDQLPSDAFATVPVPLNGSGRFEFEVLVQGGTVACFLTNEPAGLPRTRMYTHKMPGFEPFDGYLGVTGSTGGACQNHILHSIIIEQLPSDVCYDLPFIATREIASARSEKRQATPLNPDGTTVALWQEDDVIDVTITLSDIRQAGGQCARPTGVTLVERPPADWEVTSISDGGTSSGATGEITWNLTGAALIEGKVLSYEAVAFDAGLAVTSFSGTFEESVADALEGEVLGDRDVYKDSSFDECGGIRTWNILGCYSPGGDNPGAEAMRRDYMTDGTATELDFFWLPGATIDTDYSPGAAASTGIIGGANGWNPGGVPTVFEWYDNDGYININDDIFGGDPNQVMAYAQCYVINTTDDDIEAYMGLASDDSIAAIWDGEYYWVNSIPRGGATACAPQDITTEPLLIEPGGHVLVVKVFEGAGGFNFAARFQDAFAAPITEEGGLSVSLAPDTLPVEDLVCQRGDDGTVSLTWTNPDTADPGVPTRFEVDGTPIARTVPGSATSATLTAAEVPLDGSDHSVAVINNSGFRAKCTVLRDPIAPPELAEPGGKLFINGGRLPVTDDLGRNWAADLAYLAVDQTGTIVGQVTTAVIDAGLLGDPKVPNAVLNSERWCDCTIRYRMKVPNDRYRVILYFSETCASCVNPSLGGTSAAADAARIFDVQVEGETVRGYNPADAAVAPPGDGAGAIRVATELVFDVDVLDGRLDIRIVDLGTGNPPWNAHVKGIAIERGGGSTGPIFRRGDADAVDGVVNITDAIFILNYLFQGGLEPPCLDAADADNEFSINITDGIYLLSFLFLGGPEPPAPGPTDCGPEPANDSPEPQPLDCKLYPPGC